MTSLAVRHHIGVPRRVGVAAAVVVNPSTVMACAAVLAGTEAALAVLPAGTGNLLANNLDLPAGVAVGIALATDGHRRRIDVGAVKDANTVCDTQDTVGSSMQSRADHR